MSAYVNDEKIEGVKSRIPPATHTTLLEHGEEGVTPETCTRWLRARKGDVEVAATELANHAQWRQQFLAPFPGHKRIPCSAVDLELQREITFMLGCDKKHHPSLLVIGGRHVPQDPERTKRFISYCIDAAVHWGHLEMAKRRQQAAERGVKLERDFYDGKAVGIFDLTDFGYANSDLSALRAVFDLLQNHYVERLYKMYLYNAPYIFIGLWKVIAPLIDPRSKEKVQFVTKYDVAQQMQVHFEPESLPPLFGGTFEPMPMDRVWRIIEEQKPELKPSLPAS